MSKDLLLININSLHHLTHDDKRTKDTGIGSVETIPNAYLKIREGLIDDFGSMNDCPQYPVELIDLKGEQDVLPCFIDSHTHLVHAQSREEEFEQKLNGWTYEAIAANGGGILNSARKLQALSEDELYDRSAERLKEAIRSGTGAIEIKSGYGLSVSAELKMLRVIQRLKSSFPIPIKSTFLGAHALPKAYKNNKKAYLDLIRDEMLPNIHKENLADYIDVFCEKGFFTADEMRQITGWGEIYGLKAKVHINQFHDIGGIAVAKEMGYLSVDHLECFSEDNINELLTTSVLPVFLPGAAFFLNMQLPNGRDVIDSGLAPVLASDYNPGSSPSYNMELVQSLACIQMRMLPIEAFYASTINAAHALELSQECGGIAKKKIANCLILKKNKNFRHISYEYGSKSVDKVIIKGEIYN